MEITVIKPTNKISDTFLNNGAIKLSHYSLSGEVFIIVNIRDRNSEFYIDATYHGDKTKLLRIQNTINSNYEVNISIEPSRIEQVIDEILSLPVVREFKRAGIPVSDSYKLVRDIVNRSRIHGTMSDSMDAVCNYPGSPITKSISITDSRDKIANQLITADHEKYKFKSIHLNCGKAVIPLLLVNQISTPESIIEAADGLVDFFSDVLSNLDGLRIFDNFKKSLDILSEPSLKGVLYHYTIFELLDELYNQINETCYDKNRTK